MDERRAAPRSRLVPPVPCRVATVAPDISFGGLLVDLSEVGLGVVLNAPLPPHTLVCVELPESPVLVARVARAAREPDGTWLHGCEVLDRLPPEVVAVLLS
jgi:hypothetical protein